MNPRRKHQESGPAQVSKPYRVRLPGFLGPDADEIGLGDAIERITYAAGIKSCGGCHQRASRLNRWVVFTR
jgi:hypothetical protein